MRTRLLLILMTACLVPAWGCGADTNLLGLTAPRSHVESFENLLDMANAAYDANDLEQALRYAEAAYRLNPRSERAAVLIGFVNLSLAGGDPFKLADSLMNPNSESNPATGNGDSASETLAPSTADVLGPLKSVLGVHTDELTLMAMLDEKEPDLPVAIPRCAEEARVQVERLRRLNEVVLTVCRFTDREVRVVSDHRHYCEEPEAGRTQSNEVHFLWAFAHLVEALTFNSVLTYATVDPTGQKSNLELRVERVRSLDTSTPENLATFMAALETIGATLDAVMPASGRCSEEMPTTQLRAMLNDMLTVDAAFARLATIPPKMSSRIQKAMAKIRGAQGQEGSGISSQTKAMRSDFTMGMAKSVAEKIDALAADPSQVFDAERKDALCAALGKINDPSLAASCSP